MHSSHVIPVMDTATSQSTGNLVRVSLSGISLRRSRRVRLGLNRMGTGDIANHVLATGGVNSCGDFRGPGIITPGRFAKTGIGGKDLGIALPTGSVMILRIGWGPCIHMPSRVHVYKKVRACMSFRTYMYIASCNGSYAGSTSVLFSVSSNETKGGSVSILFSALSAIAVCFFDNLYPTLLKGVGPVTYKFFLSFVGVAL